MALRKRLERLEQRVPVPQPSGDQPVDQVRRLLATEEGREWLGELTARIVPPEWLGPSSRETER